ncbi:hypothetical protein OAL27_01535 [Verrucomicrobiales bacterium]|nr:hypothetical protein [Verrucomicrobiales bacterium]
MPKFVERPEHLATNLRSTGMWDTPVIHVYGGEEGQPISVSVETPLGVPLTYYLKPHQLHRKETRMSYYKRLMQADSERLHGLDWKMTLHATSPPVGLPKPKDGHWWSQIRKVPSRYLKTTGGNERFLFYEATAQAGAPLALAHNNGRLTARRAQSQEAGNVSNAEGYQVSLAAILDDNGHYRIGWAQQFGGGVTRIQKIEVTEFDDVRSPTQILQACRRQWQNAGMTFQEADAIVETRNDDLLGTPGMLCTYVVPQAMYDAMFPHHHRTEARQTRPHRHDLS